MEKKEKQQLPTSSSETQHHHPSPPPWLDLPDPLTELIVERLPLSDCVRFAAVCSKWRSVQTSHRLRYSPLPPPTLPLPWLFPSTLIPLDSSTCYSSFEQRFYRLKLSQTPRTRSVFSAFSNGWLLVLELLEGHRFESLFSLFNPISKLQFPVPSFPVKTPTYFAISSPPPSIPNCTILAVFSSTHLFLFRLGQPHWTPLPLPQNCPLEKHLTPPVASRGRFYCVLANWDLIIVDPLTPVPTVEHLEMEGIEEELDSDLLGKYHFYSVESNGDVLVVVKLIDLRDSYYGNWNYCTEKRMEFILFKADIARKVWVKMESLGGDRVLLLSDCSSYSLLAADLGVQENCIFFTKEKAKKVSVERRGWPRLKVFDLKTKTWTSVPRSETVAAPYESLGETSLQWFVPSIC